MSPAITNDFALNDSASQPKTNIQQVIKNSKPLKRKHGETKESDLEKEKISFLKTINQRMEARDKNQKFGCRRSLRRHDCGQIQRTPIQGKVDGQTRDRKYASQFSNGSTRKKKCLNNAGKQC